MPVTDGLQLDCLWQVCLALGCALPMQPSIATFTVYARALTKGIVKNIGKNLLKMLKSLHSWGTHITMSKVTLSPLNLDLTCLLNPSFMFPLFSLCSVFLVTPQFYLQVHQFFLLLFLNYCLSHPLNNQVFTIYWRSLNEMTILPCRVAI